MPLIKRHCWWKVYRMPFLTETRENQRCGCSLVMDVTDVFWHHNMNQMFQLPNQNMKSMVKVAFDANISMSVDSTEYIVSAVQFPDKDLCVTGLPVWKRPSKDLCWQQHRTILHALSQQHNPEVVEHIIVTILVCYMWYSTLCVSFKCLN